MQLGFKLYNICVVQLKLNKGDDAHIIYVHLLCWLCEEGKTLLLICFLSDESKTLLFRFAL